MRISQIVCLLGSVWLAAVTANAAGKPQLGDQADDFLSGSTPFYTYPQLRGLFPDGHCGFPVKYWEPQAKEKAKSGSDNLRRESQQFYLGPLGLKVTMHDKTFVHSGAHRYVYPTIFTDRHSNLAYSCFEVRKLLPDSPAAGKVQVGDLIFMINGQKFKSGKEVFPEAKYGFMRQLLQHTAKLLDESEATGVAELKILRPPEDGTERLDDDLTKVLHEFTCRKEGEREDVAIPLDGLKSINLLNCDPAHAAYSGETIWLNPRFTGPKGELLLKDLDWKWRSELEGAIQIGDQIENWEKWGAKGNVIKMFPNNELVYAVPAGYDSFKVTVVVSEGTAAKARIETPAPMKWSYALNSRVIDVKVPLPRYGKFAEEFPDNCEKSRLVAKSYVDFFLQHQAADGTWRRWGGNWTTFDFDTAIVGLALLSAGDESLSPQIKKAAYAVAATESGGWATVAGTKILFLSEYYLRTKDKGILPRLQKFITEAETTLMGHYYVGHSFDKPGYNGKGMSVGFAYVLLGLSVAAQTDATVDLKVLDGMHELCARLGRNNGGLPYGRFWNSTSVPEVPWNAAARTGPPLAAAIIYGGNRDFVEKALGMFHATYGAVDKVHACPSMGLFGANLAFCLADRPFFQQSMEYYKWKFILNRYPNTGMLTNPHNMHRATGESALGRWWQTAAATILLNAGNKNMAITGKPEYTSDRLKTHKSPASYFSHLFTTYRNDWTVAEIILGDKCPPDLKDAAAQLRGIEVDSNIREALLHFLEENAFRVARTVKDLKGIDNKTQSYAIELILGVDHIIKVSSRGSVSVSSRIPLGGLFARSDPSDLGDYRKSRANMKGTVTIAGEGFSKGGNLELEIDSSKLDPEEWKSGIVTAGGKVNWKSKETYKVPCLFEFDMGGIQVRYTRDITINNIRKVTNISELTVNQRPITIVGTLLRGGTGRVQPIQLDNGYQMDVLVPEGVELLDPKVMGFPTVKDDIVRVEYCTNGINPHYRTMKIMETEFTLKHPIACKVLNPKGIDKSLLKPIYDNDITTGFQIKSRGTIDLEFTFDSPVSISSVIGSYEGMLRAKKLLAEGLVDGQWHDLDYLTGNGIKTTKIKVILSSMTFNSAMIKEIFFAGKDSP